MPRAARETAVGAESPSRGAAHGPRLACCGVGVFLPSCFCLDLWLRPTVRAQCTAKEIDSFLSPDCNQIYGVEQAEMFENKCGSRCLACVRQGEPGRVPELLSSERCVALRCGNRSLNSFECPQCPCTLTTMSEEGLVRTQAPAPGLRRESCWSVLTAARVCCHTQGFYLWCSFCRWDSTSLVIEQLGNQPFVDEKPDQLICMPACLISARAAAPGS